VRERGWGEGRRWRGVEGDGRPLRERPAGVEGGELRRQLSSLLILGLPAEVCWDLWLRRSKEEDEEEEKRRRRDLFARRINVQRV
jgi:hypothetical protein